MPKAIQPGVKIFQFDVHILSPLVLGLMGRGRVRRATVGGADPALVLRKQPCPAPEASWAV